MLDNTNAAGAANTGMPTAPPAGPAPMAPPAGAMAPPAGRPVPQRRYGHGRRAFYGLLWAVWTVVFAVGGIAALSGHQIVAGLVGLVLAALAGHYDYRIWTWRARRLLFLIIW